MMCERSKSVQMVFRSRGGGSSLSVTLSYCLSAVSHLQIQAGLASELTFQIALHPRTFAWYQNLASPSCFFGYSSTKLFLKKNPKKHIQLKTSLFTPVWIWRSEVCSKNDNLKDLESRLNRETSVQVWKDFTLLAIQMI